MKHRASRMRIIVLFGAVLLVAGVVVRLLWWGEVRAWWYRDYTEVRVVEDSDWFDYPVGAPNAKGYYRAQRFGGENLHLGEDWNGMGGGNSDFGDPVYAIADGRVVSCEVVGGGWGNVVRIIHPVNDGESVEAVYAHLAGMSVCDGDLVKRGQVIGTIGDADGAYPAHLHFEIRTKPGLGLGGGYGRKDSFCDPSEFIDRHRKKASGAEVDKDRDAIN